jgi:hypothetical protein
VAVLLAVLGLSVALAPEKVPGLILPDSPEAAQAMESMGMDEVGSTGMPMDEKGAMPMDEKGTTGMPMPERDAMPVDEGG